MPTPDTYLLYFFVVFLVCVGAGLLGSLVGLGGGIFVVPLLTLIFHVPFPVAAGASIVSVIATSSGAAAAYVRDHIVNLRVGMFLEVATTIGALCGAFLVTLLPPGILFVLFGLVLLAAMLPSLAKLGEELPQHVQNDALSKRLALAGSYPDPQLHRVVRYNVTRVPLGFGIMYVAGALSGLLGIGSGPFKVLALDSAMRLPMKVSTTTSNFMIGVTAAASAGLYFARGDINPLIATPVALGVLCGAMIGARTLSRFSNTTLKKVFLLVLAIFAINMLVRGIATLLG